MHLQMGINEFSGQPLRGDLMGVFICRRLPSALWEPVANARWAVHAGFSSVLVTSSWLQAHDSQPAHLAPGYYRIHLGLSYWWGQRNLFVRVR
jgi:hypothetical protein